MGGLWHYFTHIYTFPKLLTISHWKNDGGHRESPWQNSRHEDSPEGVGSRDATEAINHSWSKEGHHNKPA